MLGLVLALCSCSEGGSVDAPPQKKGLTERVAVLMGGWPHAKAITETGKATAYRITQDPDQDYKEVMISEGVGLTPEQRKTLVDLLARDDAYGWEIAKGCEPMPGVLITFEDGATYARVRLCFSCRMVGYRPGSWEDFDPISAGLIEWVKGVFPEDRAIRSLGTDDEATGL